MQGHPYLHVMVKYNSLYKILYLRIIILYWKNLIVITNIFKHDFFLILLDLWCSNKKIALKSGEGYYITANSAGQVTLDTKIIGRSESLIVETLTGNKIALKSIYGKYLIANVQYFSAKSEVHGTSGIFEVERTAENQIALKTSHNSYMVVETIQRGQRQFVRLRTDGTEIGCCGNFFVECIGILMI